MLEFNVTVSFPAAPLLTVILALVGEYSLVLFIIIIYLFIYHQPIDYISPLLGVGLCQSTPLHAVFSFPVFNDDEV